ncbi:MAG: HD domain-containing protein [Bdellovibrionota bacterium]
MATKPFLSSEDQLLAPSKLKAPAHVPDGIETRVEEFSSLEFSEWLGQKLQTKLAKHPDWKDVKPVALGSWSRGELSPKSDIDMLFFGDEAAVKRLVAAVAREGLKLRYRMPADLTDWTVGVEPFDILALLRAIPLDESARPRLEDQQKQLRARGPELKKTLVRAMIDERESRAERFDSISNYLEPNLKYGPGGLRDLEQALALRDLDPDRFHGSDARHAFEVLLYYKRFFLTVRQRLHFSEGGTEILSAPEQKPIADWFGFPSPRDFMKEIQKGVARVSFYADWAFEQATATKSRLAKVGQVKLDKPIKLFEALENDCSLLMQNRVRQTADAVFMRSDAKTSATKRAIGKQLTRLLSPATPEGPLIALFRSRLIDHCVPEFRRIVGHVQHDQYHRFSVDAHILQALRELKRLKKKPGIAGRLQPAVKSLTPGEWDTLAFSCLYHDIAKGREGDHSIEGIAIARDDLKAFGKTEALITDVTWIVEQHLALSAAAFRENSRSPRTWDSLNERGVRGRRLPLLAVFTIVDIRATNPEAWTPWKERLLGDLVSQLEKPEAGFVVRFMDDLAAAHLDRGWGERFDPFLLSSIPSKHIIDDLKKALKGTESLPPRAIHTRKGATWVRFHSKEDKPGLFAGYVALLSSLGLPVRHASIHTNDEIGVYDWFEVRTTKKPGAIEKLLKLASPQKLAPQAKPVHFDSIDVVSSDDTEWVLSFRGRDQSGALREAARALFEEQVQLRWARVHTWGRQMDDIFGVAPVASGPESLVARLRLRLITSDSKSASTKT